MGQTVYADVLFLINFSMDFLVLYICSRLMRRRIYPLRCSLSAAIGGLYGIVSLFIPNIGFLPMLCDGSVLLLICTIAFAHKGGRLRDLFTVCAVFAGVSALLGGVMMTLYSALNRSGLSDPERGSGDDISVWLFAVLAAAGGAAAFVGGRRMKRLAMSREAEVTVCINSKKAVFKAMTDTGNMLSDPLSGRGVLICETDAIKHLFTDDLVEFWNCGTIGAASVLPEQYLSAIRYVPASGAIAKQHRILAAINADNVIVSADGKTVETDLLVAPVPQKLSAGSCRGLLPPGII